MIWNAFYDEYGFEPKNANILLKFVKSSDLNNIKYKTAKELLKAYKGRGRIREKLGNTADDIIKSLPTAKAKRNANDQNRI